MWIFGWKGPSGFSARSTAEEVTEGIDATGLTAIVTGATSGIGVDTTRVLALRGAHVVMAVRNVEAGKKLKESILNEIPSAKIDVMQLELSSMASVRKFASEYIASCLPLNILINNAGIMAPPFSLSPDGIELQFATNHVGHFLLTHLLLDTMKKTARESNREGRIVLVSSDGHKFAYNEGIRLDKINNEAEYNCYRAYGQSKVANILHAKELARRLKEEGVNITANSLHPGEIATNLARNNGLLNGNIYAHQCLDSIKLSMLRRVVCFLILLPQVKGVSGEFFKDSNLSKPGTAPAQDEELAKQLWDFSMKMIKKQ
ncbi:unnamed protein product [Linum tenue]|uniref:Short-chain dehydrogenase TIC 32, chloroplastic n=1 Tax=Linum tenue TaxID=586396 RepID=A0AAV0PYA3_9ROSI|nr:unnamed protein product [Linum tenue]